MLHYLQPYNCHIFNYFWVVGVLLGVIPAVPETTFRKYNRGSHKDLWIFSLTLCYSLPGCNTNNQR